MVVVQCGKIAQKAIKFPEQYQESEVNFQLNSYFLGCTTTSKPQVNGENL
jgi:hypothetical protein